MTEKTKTSIVLLVSHFLLLAWFLLHVNPSVINKFKSKMINQVTLIGRIGAEPEIRTLENGTKVGRFSIATSESYKDKEGNWQQTTEWHNVVVWRDVAERCQGFPKGALIFVQGKISYRKYTDKDGAEKTVTDIVASTVRKLEKTEGSTTGTDHRFPTSDPGKEYSTAEKAVHGAPQPAAAQTKASDDNLPF